MLSEQIAKYRKALSMTQEELGKRVGVSTQAVSRWECGGAPDVSLLPAIADTLGVTIDALFGIDGGQRTDPLQALTGWLGAQQVHRRLEALCRLIWRASSAVPSSEPVADLDYQRFCQMCDDSGKGPALMRSAVALEQGIMLSIGAEDMSFFSIFPEPEAGFDAYFAPPEDCRRLFGVLAQPGLLEAWLALAQTKRTRLHTARGLARRMEVPLERAADIMESLAHAGLLEKTEIELDSELLAAYTLQHSEALVPFLYLTRWLCEDSGSYFICWQDRDVMLPSGEKRAGPKTRNDNCEMKKET